MPSFAVPALMMIVSGSLHAVVNAIVKSGDDRMAARAATDGTSALLLLPAIALVPAPGGAWPYLAASALIHGVYLYALVRTYDVADLSADRCAAGRFWPGAALLVGYDARASRPPRALRQTKIAAVPVVQHDRKPL